MILNELGLIVRDSWLSIADRRSNVSLDQFVVMPNHLHGIILIGETEHLEISVAESIAYRLTSGNLSSGSLGTIVGQFKGVVTKRAKTLSKPSDLRIWQRNFYEHIIRDENSLNKIRAYIYRIRCDGPRIHYMLNSEYAVHRHSGQYSLTPN